MREGRVEARKGEEGVRAWGRGGRNEDWDELRGELDGFFGI